MEDASAQVPQGVQVAPASDVQEAPKPQNSSKIIAAIAVFVVLAVLVGGLIFYLKNKPTTQTTPLTSTTGGGQQTNLPQSIPTVAQTPNQQVDADTQAIDTSLSTLDNQTARIDSGLNDQQTDLTP